MVIVHSYVNVYQRVTDPGSLFHHKFVLRLTQYSCGRIRHADIFVKHFTKPEGVLLLPAASFCCSSSENYLLYIYKIILIILPYHNHSCMICW